MSTFEEGFSATEKAADSVLQALGDVSRLARQLQRDARAGNIAAVRRGAARLEESLSLIRQQVGNATQAWPFAPEEELAYLQRQYAGELQKEAEKQGLQIFERDGRLIAHPSVLRVLPGDRAVRIASGRKSSRSSSIRPTKIVADLAKLQQSPPRFRPQPFLESLYGAYLELSQSDTADRLKLGGVGQVVRLDRIYGYSRVCPMPSENTASWTSPGTCIAWKTAVSRKFAQDLGYPSRRPRAPEIPGGPSLS